MNIKISDDDLALLVRAVEHYHACTVATKNEDSQYKELADRLKRKPTQRVAVAEARQARGTKRSRLKTHRSEPQPHTARVSGISCQRSDEGTLDQGVLAGRQENV